MKYILTKEQKNRLNDTILEYFEKNIVPTNGWETDVSYKNEIEENQGELFINLSGMDNNDFYDDDHIWYSECDNSNLNKPLDEGTCPALRLAKSLYYALNSYFGDNWKPLFRRWFMIKTGLFVLNIDQI